MAHVSIRLATVERCEEIQNVFNHKDIIEQLGGFTMLQNLKDRCKPGAPGLWYAELNGQVVGAMMAAGRPQAHLLKFGEVGTLPIVRKQGIASALYLALTCQGILEGRRLFEDTIVGDNPHQFEVLPKLGLEQVGRLKHRTASCKDICLFQLTLLEPNALDLMFQRLERTGYTIELRSNYYTDDVWPKNMAILEKTPHRSMVEQMGQLRDYITKHPLIKVQRIDANPTDERRARFRQQTIVE